tara:strand:- start:623 stop:811 length:189 start_codon:yes stop_codon:yes gene_type:complete
MTKVFFGGAAIAGKLSARTVRTASGHATKNRKNLPIVVPPKMPAESTKKNLERAYFEPLCTN